MIATVLDLKENIKIIPILTEKLKEMLKIRSYFLLLEEYKRPIILQVLIYFLHIYGPSYLSFEYGLSFHKLIPERVILYILPPVGSLKELKALLFENLRIDIDVFRLLNF